MQVSVVNGSSSAPSNQESISTYKWAHLAHTQLRRSEYSRRKATISFQQPYSSPSLFTHSSSTCNQIFFSSSMGWLSPFITAAVAFLAIGVMFSPKLTTLSTAHLLSFSTLSFSTAFGAALGVIFIGGIIIMYRHSMSAGWKELSSIARDWLSRFITLVAFSAIGVIFSLESFSIVLFIGGIIIMYRHSMSAGWKELSSIARRFITVVAFLVIGVIFSPETLGSKSTKLSTFLKLAHLLSFFTAFGAALWVTFIGDNIMFRNLSRHQFGDLQSKMFPAYFLMLGVCCAVSVTSFEYLHPWRTSSTIERFQHGFLLLSFLFNLANMFVFTPMIIEMMKQRHKMEKENNIGEEELWSNNVEVEAMNKKFGMIHGLSYLANIMSIGCLAIHLIYLAGKIDL